MSKVAIIGRGYVGQAYKKLFPEAIFYERHGETNREAVNACDLSIVCVPTKMNDDGSCDVSIVEEVVSWLETPLILIKSTVTPGTTKRLKQTTNKRICHSPEYVGEGGYFVPFWEYPHPTEPIYHSFMIIGGDPRDREDILQIFYPVLGASKTYYQTTETASEIIKYMENCGIAAKKILCDEFYNIARAYGESYSDVRGGFVLDKRQGEMFTLVYKDRRGFDGKCLPKDLNAIVHAAHQVGYEAEFLKEILRSNRRIREET